jgi:hypothetical protein
VGGPGSPQPKLGDLAELLINLTASVHGIHDVSIYSRRHKEAPWHRLRLDENDVLRAAPVTPPFLKHIRRQEDDGELMVEADSDLFMSRRKMVMLVNITNAGDGGDTYFKIGITRNGVACLIGEGAAQGDLTPEIIATDRSEIGQLGENFNQMVRGLREWQRIKTIEMELEKGRAIQRDFLPRELPRHPNRDIATRFQPAREVSGDFYDAFDLPGGMLGLVIAEVCFNIGALQSAPGDLLLGVTDGVTEARNAADELFTRQRLRDLLDHPAGSAKEMLERIGEQLATFIGKAPALDDVTLLAVQRASG